jgi:phosphopantothenoylcysteine decarboxylase/phosphopantothenate--cysteine ligase
MLHEKKIILGITGSIAAYKAAHLVRLLVKEGAEVQVIMTKAATDFITPLTLSTLSKKPVLQTYFEEKTGTWNNHVELGLWADLMLIAPASANTLSKAAHGICDNLLMATYLSARCPVVWCPAMDADMLIHPATQNNVDLLKSYGNYVIESNYGELASGLVAKGRMAEPEEIVDWLDLFFSQNTYPFSGKTVLISAGPTYEAIDPVRFIGNHSSGKMGFAIADAFAQSGAKVILVAGPTSLQTRNSNNVQRINVTSAQEMYEACTQHYENADIAIMTAAVADYRPENIANQKIKKEKADHVTLHLVPNPDILSELGKRKKAHQFLVGFALETNNELENALGKLERKNLDMIVLNSLQEAGAGFQKDTNKITIIDKNKNILPFELKSKQAVAQDILATIFKLMYSE